MNELAWILDQLDYVPPHREDEEFEKELREALWIMGHTREDIDDGTLRAPYDGKRIAICDGNGSARMINVNKSYITTSSNSNEEVWTKLDEDY